MDCYKELQFDSPQSVYDPIRRWCELGTYDKKLLLKEEVWRDMKRYLSNVDVISYDEKNNLKEKYIKKYVKSEYDESKKRELQVSVIDPVMRKLLKRDGKNCCYRVVHDS